MGTKNGSSRGAAKLFMARIKKTVRKKAITSTKMPIKMIKPVNVGPSQVREYYLLLKLKLAIINSLKVPWLTKYCA